ncbi:amidase [Pseudomonas syringae]|uniref:Amidase n=1 Tax=Pseudomonas syringae pv. aceris TaxID=199198 RepID=A0A0L8IPW9_PSESX|nr:amidase [Pseudomonas syringae]EGH71566.1 amidase [Pseudomonas syringae pv. aceris str. M302273]KOG03473.1 Amidase [Pseudomonas syringae pv. aceris]KPW09209.1 Amidase [Pseudomonas syringae pv. aceris]
MKHLTLAEASRLIARGVLSPVTLVEQTLEHIRRVDPFLNAYVTVNGEEAIAAAHLAQDAIRNGQWLGPLHGIPIAVKDIIDTAGTTTTCHSRLYADHVPAHDAAVVSLLKAAGAIIIGKASTWEFAIGGTAFDLPWPPARNPWQFETDPSGSSSGSAVAVAAGMCLGALGSDTGGSIRGPAAWCGVAGFKPTYGLISVDGVFPLSHSLDHVGPMAWTVEDCAIMAQVMIGASGVEALSSQGAEASLTADLDGDVRGLRVGIVRHFHEKDAPCEMEVKLAFDEAVAFFKESGCEIVDVTLAPLQTYQDVGVVVARAEAFALHHTDIENDPLAYGRMTRLRVTAGAFLSAADYGDAKKLQSTLVEQAEKAMLDVDVLLMPTRGTVATALGQYDPLKSRQIYTQPFNVLGFPALALSMGQACSGLPISLQVVARSFNDAMALRVGHFFEKHHKTRVARPDLDAIVKAGTSPQVTPDVRPVETRRS